MKYYYATILLAISAIPFTIYMSKGYNEVDRIMLNNSGTFITAVGMYLPLSSFVVDQPIEVQVMICIDSGGVIAEPYCHISWE